MNRAMIMLWVALGGRMITGTDWFVAPAQDMVNGLVAFVITCVGDGFCLLWVLFASGFAR